MDMPRIKAVEPLDNMTLAVEWADGTRSNANLTGWVATAGEILQPLSAPEIWKTANVTDYGATVEWAGDDLAIDAHHLSLIAEDQCDFGVEDLHRWQEEAGLSNNEAADFLGVTLRTWTNYRAGAPISNLVKMVLRASQRDPVIMHANFRPRRPGRPRKAS